MLYRFAILMLLAVPMVSSGCSTLHTSTNPSAGSRTAVKRTATHKLSSADTIPNAADVGL